MRTAIITRRPGQNTDLVTIYTQSGAVLSYREAATDARIDRILARFEVDATRVSVG